MEHTPMPWGLSLVLMGRTDPSNSLHFRFGPQELRKLPDSCHNTAFFICSTYIIILEEYALPVCFYIK